uniref:NrS-1 polymerase-like helicase domain-containing protein n=1 Tax=Los Azufres archaeal virus 2 TaxID=1425359 RepID=A0A0A0P3T8_9VIRU|nr:hypothetical protein [Los Azufres archaeal virus 2]
MTEVEETPRSIDDIYLELRAQLDGKVNECHVKGHILFCKPCPDHPDVEGDMLFYDPFRARWACLKDPYTPKTSIALFGEEGVEYELPTLSSKAEEALRKKAKSNVVYTGEAEVVELHFVLENLLISLDTKKKGYEVYKYVAENGHYDLISSDKLRAELQYIYENVWGRKPPATILSEMMNKIYKLTEREEGYKVFDHAGPDYFFIPARDKDVKVNRLTGQVEFLDKDPVGRPFLTALPYNLGAPPENMPKAIKELLRYVPPGFQNTLLAELVAPLSFSGKREIYVNFSRLGGTGKSTVLHRIKEIYQDLAIYEESEVLGERFEKSLLVGKVALLIDEYKGRKENELKLLASNNELRVEHKHGAIINIPNRITVIMATNELRFSPDMAFLSRLVIVPFVWNHPRQQLPELTEKEREEAISWLIHWALPRYLKNQIAPKQYPLDLIKKWAAGYFKREEPEPPEGRVEEFISEYFHMEPEEREFHGKFVTLKEAFEYYLMWADKFNVLPVSFEEFLDVVTYMKVRDRGAWVFERGGQEIMYMKRAGLSFFL